VICGVATVRFWPFSEGSDFPKQDAQAAAVGKTGRSIAMFIPDRNSPLVTQCDGAILLI
jgi:hypothetical protein